MELEEIKIFGPHDESTLAQIRRSASHPAVRGAVLAADGHKGYAVPIGGVVAYEDKISPSGVGFDIGCVGARTRVLTVDGFSLAVEEVMAQDELLCWDGKQTRPIAGHSGHIATGTKPTLALTLANGRRLTLTADHLVRTSEGWKPAGSLTIDDRIACPVFTGLPFGEATLPAVRTGDACQDAVVEALRRHTRPAQLAALVRLLGAVSGDGHIPRDGKYLCIYTTDATDAQAMARDVAVLGYEAKIYTRGRKPGHLDEIQVRVNSTTLNAMFVLLGSPAGKKAWGPSPMPWLLTMPAWVRAQFLSAFGSAECMTPRPQNTTIPNLQIKQSGENDNALRFIGRLLESLCFEVSIAPSGPERGTRRDHVLQILGGAKEQLRYLEEIGFCHAQKKRLRGAEVAGILWQRLAQQEKREAARQEAKSLHAGGMYWKDVKCTVAEKYGVTLGFVHHAIYDDRGTLRRERGAVFTPDTTGEICWVPVLEIAEGIPTAVYDIATADAAHCFFADGLVVHNCGNKAVLTDMPASEVRAKIKIIMDDVWKNLSFGIGRTNNTTVEHELFDDETWKLSAVKSLKQMAQNQLGTIGSGVRRPAL